jgi:heavy metal translocating P-type ATPase
MWSLLEVRAVTVATALFALGLVTRLAGGPEELWWALYLGCYLAGGTAPGLAGLRALRNRTLDVDLLMVAAAIGAAAIGQVLDGALLIVIFATSGALEALATRRTEDSVRGLLALAPERATRLTATGEEIVPAAALRVGDVILVRPGERIGGDGDVVDGASEVDQASITGEPLPVDRRTGDRVFAGTVNGTGALQVRVTRPAGDTLIARIVTMVQQASTTKARTQLFIERIEQRYSLAMVTATLALFVIPLLLGTDLRPTLLRAMTFMIVASPCAVVLATMPPLLSAIATASRNGVLVKSTAVLEHLATATHVAFDKTGTLTDGNPRLAHIHVLGTITEDDVLAYAAAAENPSEHPLARAIVTAARDRGITPHAAEGFTAQPGRGVTARVNGQLVDIGSPAQILPTDSQHDDTANLVTATENAGYTAVVVRINATPAAVLALTDQTRPDAADTIARLTALTGNRPVLLTGDNPSAATRLATDLGISDVHASLLPEDKVDAVRGLEATGARLVVIGDGVNDAPALAAAHIGIAMGRAGSDLTLDTADVVITRDELATLPALIALARRARRLVIVNLAIAATFIAIFAAWDLFATLPLPLGVAGHEGSTIIVGLNGLRLLRTHAWHRAQHTKPTGKEPDQSK